MHNNRLKDYFDDNGKSTLDAKTNIDVDAHGQMNDLQAISEQLHSTMGLKLFNITCVTDAKKEANELLAVDFDSLNDIETSKHSLNANILCQNISRFSQKCVKENNFYDSLKCLMVIRKLSKYCDFDAELTQKLNEIIARVQLAKLLKSAKDRKDKHS